MSTPQLVEAFYARSTIRMPFRDEAAMTARVEDATSDPAAEPDDDGQAVRAGACKA